MVAASRPPLCVECITDRGHCQFKNKNILFLGQTKTLFNVANSLFFFVAVLCLYNVINDFCYPIGIVYVLDFYAHTVLPTFVLIVTVAGIILHPRRIARPLHATDNRIIGDLQHRHLPPQTPHFLGYTRYRPLASPRR